MEISADFGDAGSGGSSRHSNFVQDDPPLAPPPLHYASPVVHIDVDSEESNEEYVADINEEYGS
ncbi:hypothetical protein AHAS_Ahas14G0156000 [Arachis hypogaea]